MSQESNSPDDPSRPDSPDEGSDPLDFPEEILRALSADEQNLKTSLVLLDRWGILQAFEDMNVIFSELSDAVAAMANSTSPHPLVTNDDNGDVRFVSDFLMRTYLALSAPQQFYVATGHLLRGHVSDVFPHIRRAIEGAGIAYLSRTAPEIGDLFIQNNRNAFRACTGTDQIFPRSDPITNELRISNDLANRQIHNNIESFTRRIRHSASGGTLRIDIQYHEIDGDSMGYFVNTALWMLRVAERVAHAFAASFGLPESQQWYQHLDRYARLVASLYAAHGSMIRADFIEREDDSAGDA